MLIVCLSVSSVLGAKGDQYSTKPTTNKGKKWRIGFLEGGPYSNYPLNLRALVLALAGLGWLEATKLPPSLNDDDTKQLWDWLSLNIKSKYIQFVGDAYWSSGWDKELRSKNKKAILDRLNVVHDIDLMIAMGTKAGQDLATNDHSVPTIVMSSSDPVGSKIIKSAADSGFDHVNARVDPYRYERQVRIFHDFFGFDTLGIVYETDTIDGKTYAAINDVRQVGKERGFEIIECHAPFSNVSREEAKTSVLKCHKELAKKVDAFYLTVHRGVTFKKMDKLLSPFFEYQVPVFSQRGSKEVKHGALLSLARAGFKFISKFHAETIAKIFNGAKPSDLEQVFEDPPRIAINLKAAEKTAYTPPIEVLNAADEIYQKIVKTQ